jgi:NAD(P) transhydrogenase subunit alpha
MAPAASAAYARNLAAVTAHLLQPGGVRDGALAIDLSDEIVSAIVVTHEGRLLT